MYSYGNTSSIREPAAAERVGPAVHRVAVAADHLGRPTRDEHERGQVGQLGVDHGVLGQQRKGLGDVGRDPIALGRDDVGGEIDRGLALAAR